MIIDFTLVVPSFSVNKYYYRRGKSVVRTSPAREWGANVHEQLAVLNLQPQFEAFRKAFKPSKHGIHVDLTFFVERSLYFTKKGLINIRSKDLTNVEKPLVDLIFDERYFNRDGIQNLAINDKHIISLHSRKLPADISTIKVVISLVDMPK